MAGKNISMAVIRRLPKYYRYLGDLLDNDVQRISSKELSEIIGFTASQIRQDLNNFGGFGQQGYGYNIEALHTEIGKILWLDRPYSAKFHNPFIPHATNLSANSWAPFFGTHKIPISILFSLTKSSILSESNISNSLIFNPIILGFASNNPFISNPAFLNPE